MDPDAADPTLPESDRRELISWAVDSVERLLPTYDQIAPGDERLTEALDGARAFARGQRGVAGVRRLALACHAAARETEDAAASAVARAAGQAAAVAHMAAHGRQIARYTRKALSGPAVTAELDRQRAQVPARFRDYVYG